MDVTADTPHTETETGDSVQAPADELAGEGGDTMLTRLAVRYVKERLAKGEINKRSAAVTRSRLFSFTTTTQVPPARLNRRHIERWMATPGLSPAYRRARLSTIRGFCRWLILKGMMKSDPTLGVTAPRLPRYLPRSLAHDDASAVIAAAVDNRARAIGLLMLQEGFRRVEVSRAQLGDVDLRRKQILVRGKGGLGEITRVLPLSDETTSALRRYLDEHPAKAGPLIRSYVRTHEGLTPGHVGEIVHRMFVDSGVKQVSGDGRSAHALRHTMATDLVERGASMVELQQALGHASMVTSQTYIRGVVGNLRQAMDGRSYA